MRAGRCGRLDHLRHREGLARAGDAEQDLRAIAALDALDQLLDRLRLSPFGSKSEAILKRMPPSDFLRSRWTVRRPRNRGKFRPALAQQPLERLLARDAAEASRLRRQIGARQAIFRVLFAGRRRGLFVAKAQLPGQLRIEARDGRRRIVALRSLVEFPGRRLACLVGLREIAPAVPRIVGRRLQSRARPHARRAVAYSRIEDFRQRIRSRFVVRSRRLGARRFGRILRLFGRGFRHCPEYGASVRD
jgi:hypothetical protein